MTTEPTHPSDEDEADRLAAEADAAAALIQETDDAELHSHGEDGRNG